MNILKLISIFLIILVIIKILKTIGNYLANLLKIELSFNTQVIFGFSVLNIFLYFSYFFLKIDNFLILSFSFIIVLILLIRDFNLNENKKDHLILLLICIVYLIPAITFKEQFYVFRGNYWDHFNYLSSASLFHEYNYSEILRNNFDTNYLFFQSINQIIEYRPITNYLLSILLNLKFLDIFLINYVFKIFCICLIFLSFKEFISNFELHEKEKYLLSIIFIFSFWTIFIFEIDANSHLVSISIFLLCIKNLDLFFENLKNNRKNYIVFYIINLAALFIIYPEIIFVFSLILLIYFFFSLLKFKLNRDLFINIFFSLILFIFLIIPSYKTNIEFLIMQIGQALDPSLDWWGYYGAFILGRDNLVTNNEVVQLIKLNIGSNIFETLKSIYFIHYENNYKFIYLNFIPSLFGLYHLTIGKILNVWDYIISFLLIFLNLYLLKIIIKNYIIIKKFKFYIISFFIVFLFLIFNKNFWTVIKIYSYIFPFLFLFFSISFKDKKINKLYLVMLLSFIFYKYSVFNFGIGRMDSFPSIINKNFKENVIWSVDKEKLKNCVNAKINVKEYFKKAYILLKLKHQDIEINSQNTKDDNNLFCEINFENKLFRIEINE